MTRRLIPLFLLCLLGLSGCVFGSLEELYALPKPSESYVDLQAKINRARGGAEYIAPVSGENRQTIQLVDLDGDGRQEAVVFFRDPASDTPLKIVVFRQDRRNDYQVYARIEGVGTEIESIQYLDLGGGGSCDILVSWQASSSVRTLVGYTLTEGQAVEILRSGYSRYLTADLDGDGQEEVFLAQPDASSHWRIEYYDGQEGAMELVSAAPLSEGAADISTWSAGRLEEALPALFVTSYFEGDQMITDVFCLDEEGLKNVALDPDEGRSLATFRYYAGVSPADMNGDGITEVPVGMPVKAFGESTVDQFWWLSWRQYSAEGDNTRVLTTYHSGDGSWYLEIPDHWEGEFQMNRQESAATGVRTVTFARVPWAGAEPQRFLTITCLVGGDRMEQARQTGRFILYADSTTLYTGEFPDGGWDCGLTPEELQRRFHSGTDALADSREAVSPAAGG